MSLTNKILNNLNEENISPRDRALETEIKVYDIDSWIQKENPEWESHTFGQGAAIITKPDGTGCIVDYEGVGSSFNSMDEDIKIDLHPHEKEEDGKIAIYPVATATLTTTPYEIVSEASSKTMKASDFFTKNNYNDRCATNFDNLVPYILNESSLKEAKDDEWKTYEIGVGFCGYIGVEEVYNIQARSTAEAIGYALDEPGSEAELDLSADNIEDNGDGSYTVTVSFAGNIGADNEYTVSADDEDEAETLALEDAKDDLEITSVNGKEYEYGQEYEEEK